MQNHPMYGTVLHLLYTYKGGLFFISMNSDKRRLLKCLIFFMRWEYCTASVSGDAYRQLSSDCND